MLTAGDVTHGVGRLTAIIIILLVLVDALTMLASAFQSSRWDGQSYEVVMAETNNDSQVSK